MERRSQSGSYSDAKKQQSPADMLKTLEENCRKCNPLTPITCITECKTWRMKNQLRKINEKMQKPKFLEQLLNTLKNGRRLQILDLISRQGCSVSQLQEKLTSLGYRHSQQTIVEEYVNPLIDVGLIEEDGNTYHVTVLGLKVNESVRDFPGLEKILPPHSECYEEATLYALLEGSRTYREVRTIIPPRSAARVLSRLRRTGLVETRKEKNYIFLFKTRRDSNLERLSPTGRKVYGNIASDGISAKRLSEKTGISLRRTYKYLRRLKGKKLVFTRKEPLGYVLTTEGARVAATLKRMRSLAIETQAMTAQLLGSEKTTEPPAQRTRSMNKKNEEIVALTDTSYTLHH
jgi:DNA-binding transcriptional ArsR family regulator/DNA-binding PadR family transcriptional regulator